MLTYRRPSKAAIDYTRECENLDCQKPALVDYCFCSVKCQEAAIEEFMGPTGDLSHFPGANVDKSRLIPGKSK